MKKFFLFAAVTLLSLTASAQTTESQPRETTTTQAAAGALKFGYFSYEEAMKSSADYSLIQRNMADLRAKYDAEMKRVEDEFNKKYEDFLDGQRNFAPSILKKRQAELQELRSEEHTSELQSRQYLVCRLLLEKKNKP